MSKDDVVMERMEPEESGIDLLAVLVALLSEWRIWLITFVTVSVVCCVFVFSLKPEFVATATILPQEGRSDTASLASLFASHGPGTLYIGLLGSRSVKDYVADHANLRQLFQTQTEEQTRDVLAGKSTFANLPDSLLTISVRDGNAQDAARIANTYIDALANLNATMSLQQSSQTTAFFEQQLDKERAALAGAETEFARVQKSTGLVAPDTQTQIGLGAIASIRSEITSRQVQLTALLQSETEQNPNVQTLRSQIALLQVQERRLEGGAGGTPVGAAPAAGQMPQTNLDLARAQREVKYHDSLVTSLASQFEAARLNEAFRHSAFQVVDRAVAPEHKAWPPRTPYLVGSLGFGVVMGFIAVLMRLLWRDRKSVV